MIYKIMRLSKIFIGGKKRKRSRWGAKEERTIVTGPLTLPANMTEEQRKNYLCKYFQILF